MIIIKNLTKKYNDRAVFTDYSLHILPAQKVLITGDSGAGKTTLLRCIAGLEQYSGEIILAGDVSYVFQESRFMPWLTIKDNLLLPLKLKNLESGRFYDAILKMAKDLSVHEHLNKYPEQVSGGELQRLAIVRALFVPSKCLLLDEPLKGVQQQLHTELYKYILDFVNNNNQTLIYVTHERVDSGVFDKVILL